MATSAAQVVVDLDSFRARRFRNPTDELAAKNWLQQRVDKAEREGVFAEVAPLDHGIAMELLRVNHSNRRIRKAKLTQYMEDMKSGRWLLNGEPLIISKEGHLLDGQHRCFAMLNVFEAPMVAFMFGVEHDARRTMDTGAKRFASDILSLEGIKNSSLASSAARMLIALEQGKRKLFAGRDKISTTLIVERVMEDDELQEVAHDIHKMKRKPVPGVTPGVIAAAYYLMRKKNKSQALEFIEDVFHFDHERGTPAKITYDRLLDLAGTGGREKRLEVLARGWNMKRTGQVQSIPLLGEMPRIQ